MKRTLVSGQRLAAHLGVSPTYVRKLVIAGIVERRPEGHRGAGLFDQDESRLRYLAHLRSRRAAREPLSDAGFAASLSLTDAAFASLPEVTDAAVVE